MRTLVLLMAALFLAAGLASAPAQAIGVQKEMKVGFIYISPLGIGYVGHAGKPGTRGFQEAMARSGVGAGETAMLGDKLLTDTLGARRSGVLMLMVEPKGGPDGAWNHVLHALQEPFKAASAHDERKKR